MDSVKPSAIEISVTLRQPVFGDDAPAREKIPCLESHIALTAYYQGEIAAERLEAHKRLRDLQSEWDHLDGWEMHRRGKTDASIDEAKKRIRPDLYDAISELRWLIERLTEEYDRMESEAARAGRRYTLLTGA